MKINGKFFNATNKYRHCILFETIVHNAQQYDNSYSNIEDLAGRYNIIFHK